MIPTVPWRFGEVYYVTEFIQKNNFSVKNIAEEIKGISENQDDLVFRISEKIRDDYTYPLDHLGNPATSGCLTRYKFNCLKSLFCKTENYIWALPAEVVAMGKGYCAETANLAASVLIAAGVPESWVVLGEVRKALANTLIGYHAWVECPYQEKRYVMETTVDSPGINILSPTTDAYNRKSDWAKANDVYYVPQSRYNENEYVGEGPLSGSMVKRMGMPAKRVLLLGYDKTLIENCRRPARIQKELRQEAKLVKALLHEAYARA